jgi:hypothetical protein
MGRGCSDKKQHCMRSVKKKLSDFGLEAASRAIAYYFCNPINYYLSKKSADLGYFLIVEIFLPVKFTAIFFLTASHALHL